MKKLICAIMMAAASAALATGVSISYQGQLKDGKGEPLKIQSNKILNIEFRIYDVQTGGAALWGSSFAILPDSQGYFNVELNDTDGSRINDLTTKKPIEGKLETVISTKARSSTLFIGLTVEGSTGEIAPRQKLLSVPVAAFALNADAASGDFTVAGTATIGGKVTANGDLEVKGKTTISGMQVNGTISLGKDARIKTAEAVDLVPSGVIVMWSGTKDNIPLGWALCDGKDGRPDLQNRFVIGAGGKYGPRATGGYEKVTLTVDQLPAHSHGFGLGWGWSYDNVGHAKYWRQSGTDGGWQGMGTDNTGGNQAHENMPPYYALCYIIKL